MWKRHRTQLSGYGGTLRPTSHATGMPLFALTDVIDCYTRQPYQGADDDGCRRRQPENHSHGHKVYTF